MPGLNSNNVLTGQDAGKVSDKQDVGKAQGRPARGRASDMKEQLALVDKLSKGIISSAEISELFQRFADALSELMDMDWAAVGLIDATGDSIHLSRLSPNISSSWNLGTTIVLPGTPLEKMVQVKRAIVEPDLSQESQFWPSVFFLKQGLRSVVHMPLFFRREVFGALIIGSQRPNAYQERELKLLKYAVCQIAAPIEAARSDIQKRRLTETETIIEKLISIVSGSKDMAQAYPAFAQELKGLVDFDRCSTTMVRGKLVKVFARYPSPHGQEEGGESATYLLKGSPLEWLKANKVTNIEPDLDQERQFPVDDIHLKDGLRSEIRVPMFSHGEVFAALELSSQQPNAYGEREKALLEQLAVFLAAPVENMHLRTLEGEPLEFITAASHELKTPLTSVVASSGLLSEELQKLPEGAEKKLIRSVVDGAQALGNRLVRLLELAELRTRTPSLESEPLELKKALKDMTSRILPQVRAKGQVLVLEIPSSPLYAEGNRDKVEQLLATLFSNAIDSTPQGGTITVRATEQATNVIIEVQDSGSGYSPKEQKRLFEVYHLAEADRHFLPDLRLALANARELVKLQGGEMWVKSKPGKGSTFAFSLPKAVTA